MNWKDAVKYAKEHGATIANDEKIVFGDETKPTVIYSLSENDEFMLVNLTPDGKYITSYPCEYIKELMNPVQKINPNNIQAINFDYGLVDWEMFKDWAISIGAELNDNNTIIYEVKYDDITTRKYLFDRNGEIWLNGGGVFNENIAKYRTPTQMRDILKGLFEKGEF